MELSTFLKYRKGKSVRTRTSADNILLPILTPEYLRNNSEPELTSPANNVVVSDDEIILLWDGSNAGEFFWSKKGVLASTMVVLDFDKNRFNLDYLYYSFKQFEPQLKTQTRGSGIPHVDKDVLLRHNIQELDRKEQTKIAEVLSAIDRVITQTEALIGKHQRIKTGMMKDLLTGGIDEHGLLRDPSIHRFAKTSLGSFPLDWEVHELEFWTEKIIDKFHTTPKYVTAGVKIVSPQNFRDDDEIDFDSCPEITREEHEWNRQRTDIEIGDLIMHRIGAGLGRVRIVTPAMPEFSILHSLCMIRANDKVISSYLYWAFQSYLIQRQIKNEIQSIGVPDLGLEKIANLKFAVPNDKCEQQKIVELLDAIQNKIHDEKLSLSKLKRIKTGLMQDLLSGKVPVTALFEI